MEEQNKNTEKKENEVQTSQENTPQNATPTRSYVLMILAGCYLLRSRTSSTPPMR